MNNLFETMGFPIYPNGNGGFTLTPPNFTQPSSSSMYVGNGGFFGTIPPNFTQPSSTSSNVFFPTQTITENLNTPLGNFTSNVQIPQNAVVPPPIGQCNSIIQNVSSAIPTLLQNTVQPAGSVLKSVESAL